MNCHNIIFSFIWMIIHIQYINAQQQDNKITNFCAQNFPNLAAADGTQNRAGSCSSTVQGAIPSTANMVSTIILQPESGSEVDRTQPITISLDTANLQLGNFNDPNTQYYTSPQLLNNNGIITGHQHVVVQFLGSAQSPPSAQTFDFFKGLDGPPAQGNQLSVTIPPNTLKNDGVYRICSITGANAHQPVIMPVAQRGSQDDCIRVTSVSGNNNSNNSSTDNNANNDGNNNNSNIDNGNQNNNSGNRGNGRNNGPERRGSRGNNKNGSKNGNTNDLNNNIGGNKNNSNSEQPTPTGNGSTPTATPPITSAEPQLPNSENINNNGNRVKNKLNLNDNIDIANDDEGNNSFNGNNLNDFNGDSSGNGIAENSSGIGRFGFSGRFKR